MESLFSKAEAYLESLRNKPYTPENRFEVRRELDRWHGYCRAQSNNPAIRNNARLLYADKARAIEIRFKELDVLDLLQG